VYIIKINSEDAVECGGWGNSSGGCRLLQVLFCVLTCRLLSICVCVYILIIVCFSDNMPDFLTAVPKIARETGQTGEIETRVWVKLPISFWALLEQIRTHPSHPIFDGGSEGVNQTISYCISKEAIKLGIETG